MPKLQLVDVNQEYFKKSKNVEVEGEMKHLKRGSSPLYKMPNK